MSDGGGLERRLSLLLFLQFAIPGAWLPIVPPYLTGPLGLASWQAGWVLALPGIGSLASPWLAGQLADRHVRAERLLATLLGSSALSLWALAYARTPLTVGATILWWGLSFGPTVSLATAICLRHLPRPEDSFGRVRLWGTAGWIVAGIAVGQWLLLRHTPEGAPAVVRQAQDLGRVDGVRLGALLALAAAAYSLVAVPATPPPPRTISGWNAVGGAWRAFRRRPLVGLFVAGLPAACIDRFYLYHGAARLSEYGIGPRSALDRVFGVGGGGLMTLGQVTEMVTLAALPFLLRRFRLGSLLRFGLLAFLVRMVVLATAQHPLPVLAAVALHGVSYACFFFVGTLAVERVAPKDVRASAQALFLIVYGGIGTLVGSPLAAAVGSAAQDGDTLRWSVVFAVPAALGLLALAAFQAGWSEEPAA